MPGVFAPISPLAEHRTYIADVARLTAYEAALSALVRPGSTVLDLGCGTGVLGLLALRAGARHVYAVDSGAILQLAREIAVANGFGDRVTHFQGWSSHVTLPERVDVVIADQMSAFGMAAGLLDAFADAHTRHLSPGGVCVPGGLNLHVAPVEDRGGYEAVAFWSRPALGLQMAPAHAVASNCGHLIRVQQGQLLAEAQRVLTFDFAKTSAMRHTCDHAFTVQRSGTLHGLAGWFVAELAPGVLLSNAPRNAAEATSTASPEGPYCIDRDQLLLPLAAPVPVHAGDTLAVRLNFDLDSQLLTWRLRVDGAGGATTQHVMSTFKGRLVTREEVTSLQPSHQPQVERWGHAKHTILGLCDGAHTVRAIEETIAQEFADLFPTAAHARGFVADVIRRNAR